MRTIILAVLLVSLAVAGILRAADFDGDGVGDLAVFRPASGLWAVRGVTRAYFGGSADEPAAGDYGAEGKDRLAVFRSSSGLWAVKGLTRFYFGGSGDSPVPGDLDGDGTWEAAVFRPTSGLWAARGVTRIYFGGSADTALDPGRGAGPLRQLLPVTGQTTSYQAGDDGDHRAGAPFDLEFFSVVGVGKWTVDNNTGLIWAADGDSKGCNFNTETNWAAAVAWCENLNYLNRTDWRLPNVKELQTIVDASRSYPCVDGAKFPNTKMDFYWTSTTTRNESTWAFILDFDVLGRVDDADKTNAYYFRAVTGPVIE